MDRAGPTGIVRGAPLAAEIVVVGWGVAYAAWGGLKFLTGITPRMCEPPPIAALAVLLSAFELALGIAVVRRATRPAASLTGFATNLGLVGFAFVADARRLPWRGCGCVFEGVDFPWLPGHAVLAGALALPFLAIFVVSERRRAAARRELAAA